nr:CDP-alcohol phosphatidyltransferase family protein [Pyrinomonadaceae bacterium]
MSSKIVTIPNLLTFLRMALIPPFTVALYYNEHLIALILFFFAGISDSLDGIIARKFNQQSSLGTILDPIADKLLMTVSYIALMLPHVAPEIKHLPIPFWVTASVIGRDILIVVAALAIFIVSDFRGFKPSYLGKLSTVIQISAIGLILIAAVFPQTQSFYLPTLYAIVTGVTVIS